MGGESNFFKGWGDAAKGGRKGEKADRRGMSGENQGNIFSYSTVTKNSCVTLLAVGSRKKRGGANTSKRKGL